VARLEALGLVTRRPGGVDKRVREAVITPYGKAATDALDAAREEMALAMFHNWRRKDFEDLARLMQMLVDTMRDWTGRSTFCRSPDVRQLSS
jgi:DNA-binding MarR family transcriptional regulator